MTGSASSALSILVAIANYGQGNRDYLERLLSAYRAMPFNIDIVVLSNIPKDLGPDIEVRVGLPSDNPRSLPFAHRQLFAERQNDYDLYIYSEDDTLVEQRHVEAFLDLNSQLQDDEVAGFLRSETGPDGRVYCSSIHTQFRWRPESVRQRGDHTCACFTNEHAACFMLTRQQLHRAIASGGFLVEPHRGRYEMLESAATDPYTRCGLTKLVSLTRLDDFILPHLPNKYIGRMGLSRDQVDLQIEALLNGAASGPWHGPLVNVETRLLGAKWSKNCYEHPDEAMLDALRTTGPRVLVVGCGWGATEGRLVAEGRQVTAVPIDPVFGHMAAARGVEVVQGDMASVHKALAQHEFDAIVWPDVLHLIEQPGQVLRLFADRLAAGGQMVLRVPNHADWTCRWGQWRDVCRSNSFAESRMHMTTRWTVRRWLAEAAFKVDRVRPILSGRRQRYARMALGMADELLAEGWLIQANRG